MAERESILQQTPQRESFIAPQQQGVNPAVAFDRAHTEAFILNDPEGTDKREAAQLQGNVLDETIKTIQSKYSDKMPDIGRLASIADQPPERQRELIELELARMDAQALNARETMLYSTVLNGRGDMSLADFNSGFRKQVSPQDVQRFRRSLSNKKNEEIKGVINEFIATQDIGNFGEAFGQVLYQDFTPIIAATTRIGLNQTVYEALFNEEAKGLTQFLPGSLRQDIRKRWETLSPDEKLAGVREMVAAVREMQDSKNIGHLITEYNVLETMESLFLSDEFIDEGITKNNVDAFLGNLDVALEGIFGMAILATGFKTLKGATRSTGIVAAHKAAVVAGNNDLAARLDEIFGSQGIAVKYGKEPSDVIPVVAPKPSSFVENREILTAGSRKVLEKSEELRSRLATNLAPIRGEGLTVEEKVNVVRREMEQVDNADGSVVMPAMSHVEVKPDQTGFKMGVVIGKQPNAGYDSIEEVVDQALEIDPELFKTKVLRRTDKGTLETVPVDEIRSMRSLFGKPLADIDDAELITLSKREDISALEKTQLEREAQRRAGTSQTTKEEYFIEYEKDYSWHPWDKQFLLDEDKNMLSGTFSEFVVPPNHRFKDSIYPSIAKNYLTEQGVTSTIEQMFKPFYALKGTDKLKVEKIFEWSEQWSKNNNGAVPKLNDILSEHPNLTEKQLNGVIALREGFDTIHDLYNTRLYQEFQGLGYNTARPVSTDMARYHGKVLEGDQIKAGTYYDPALQESRKLSADEVAGLRAEGTRFMKLDTTITGVSGGKFDQLVLTPDAYRVGDLSTSVLDYRGGYFPRFYDDPYYVVKVTKNGEVNGVAKGIVEEATHTAPTKKAAERKIARMPAEDGIEWKWVRSSDISQNEGTLYQRQALQREGRMFWDERNYDRLPDVNGNQAQLENPVAAVQRMTSVAARELTREDLLKSYKSAWAEQYGPILASLDKPLDIKVKSLTEMDTELTTLIQKGLPTDLNKKLTDARSFIRYFRLLDGTNESFVPAARKFYLDFAEMFDGALGKKLSKRGAAFDPFRGFRTIAFNAFMVLRPVRQALLQSMQVGFLTALKPTYIGSGAIFKDALALRIGIGKLRGEGLDAGWSKKALAKSMGLTNKEYDRLVNQFDRSGIVDSIDVHSFKGGARRQDKFEAKGVIGTTAAAPVRAVQTGLSYAQKFGFDAGESANLLLTYNLAVKRAMDKKGIKSLMDFTRQDWDDIAVDTSNLALGMIRPNQFKYQSGLLGVTTQFLSFQHKSLMTMLGFNPSLSKLEAGKIAAMSTMLYGGSMWGARELIEEMWVTEGLDNPEIPGTGGTAVDLVASGLIDFMYNEVAQYHFTDGKAKDLELGFLAPGVDPSRFYENQIEALASQPGNVILGPFSSILGNTFKAYQFVNWYVGENPEADFTENFTVAADAMLRGALPAYNDAVTTYLGHKMGQWYTRAGEPLPLDTTFNTLIARGLLGVRSKEELAYYSFRDKVWNKEENVRNIIKANKKYMESLYTRYMDREIDEDTIRLNVQMLHNMLDEFPEGTRLRIIKESIIGRLDDGPSLSRIISDDLAARNSEQDYIAEVQHMDIPEKQKQFIIKMLKDATQSRNEIEAELLQEEFE